MDDRFRDWRPPEIRDGELTRYNWLVQHSANLKLGLRTDIGAFTYINAKCGVTIEDGVQIGSHSSIYSVSTIDEVEGPVLLRRNCRIGSHTVIMPGVTVGENAIVGACSFVNRDIPANVVAFGAPARVVRVLGAADPKRLFLSPPHLGGDEIRFVHEAFASNYIAPLGPQVDAFEQEFAAAVGAKHAAAVASGTAALHLALRIVGVGAGSEVIVPSFTFIGGVSPVLFLGASPTFVDSERASWNIDPALLEEELRERERAGRPAAAVISADILGQCADMDRLAAVCARHGVPLVSDSAEALGALYKGRPAGQGARAAIWSFNGNKIITTSGGGMLTSDDGELVAQARFLAQQARNPAPHYEHTAVGYNYRMSNVLAAIGRGQLRVLAERVRRRREIFAGYRKLLAQVPGIEFMPEAGYGRASRWLTVLLIEPAAFGADREAVRLALEARNIESRPVWKPMHLQPVFAGCRVRGGAVCADLFARGLCLPSGTAMTDADVERVAGIVREAGN